MPAWKPQATLIRRNVSAAHRKRQAQNESDAHYHKQHTAAGLKLWKEGRRPGRTTDPQTQRRAPDVNNQPPSK